MALHNIVSAEDGLPGATKRLLYGGKAEDMEASTASAGGADIKEKNKDKVKGEVSGDS